MFLLFLTYLNSNSNILYSGDGSYNRNLHNKGVECRKSGGEKSNFQKKSDLPSIEENVLIKGSSNKILSGDHYIYSGSNSTEESTNSSYQETAEDVEHVLNIFKQYSLYINLCIVFIGIIILSYLISCCWKKSKCEREEITDSMISQEDSKSVSSIF